MSASDGAAAASVETEPVGERSSRLPVSVVIPVLNEEDNIAEALSSLDWADEVFIVDSGSQDRTAELAEAAGAHVVQFEHRPPGPKKMTWSLANLPFRNDWLLMMAADERIPAELVREIDGAVREPTADGYLLDREFIFMGRSLRCMRPNLSLRLFKHRLSRMEDLGLHDLPGTGDMEVHEHIDLDGKVGRLRTALLHDDYRGLTPWLDRHNRYGTWEAHLTLKLQDEPIGLNPARIARMDAVQRKRVLRRIWVRLPARPLLRFLVWYVLRRGFLDGRPGLVYCLLMGWYELIIGVKIRELRAPASG